MRLLENGNLAVKKGKHWMVHETAFIYEAEHRVEEVAIVTPHKAPELITYFNRAWLRVGEILSDLKNELAQANQTLELAKATVLLDKVEAILTAKNLKSSKETREAVVSLDPEVKELQETVDSIKTAIVYLELKHKGFEMAYLAVRKIIGEGVYNMRNRNSHNRGSESTPVGGVREQYGSTSNNPLEG